MRRFALLLAVLGLAACHGAPPPIVSAPPPEPGLAQGVDLPTDARDVSMELKGSRLDFVARYYRDPASRWPALSSAEARSISSAGLKMVAVWESHSGNPAYFTYATGYADALAAYSEAKGVGQPQGSAIYFAVDYNPAPDAIAGPIDQYFRGVYNGMIAAAQGHVPDYRIGVYGSGAVCAYLKGARLAQFAWLSNSTAWRGYSSFTDWDIRQGMSSPLLSFSQDSNEARGEYGGFLIDAAAPADRLTAEAPPEKTQPKPLPVSRLVRRDDAV